MENVENVIYINNNLTTLLSHSSNCNSSGATHFEMTLDIHSFPYTIGLKMMCMNGNNNLYINLKNTHTHNHKSEVVISLFKCVAHDL